MQVYDTVQTTNNSNHVIMSYNSSFIKKVKGEINTHTNEACFHSFAHDYTVPSADPVAIIIEYVKIENYDKFMKYLNIIKSNFIDCITEIIDNKDCERIEVHVKNDSKIIELTLLGMFIRFAYEGYFVSPKHTNDNSDDSYFDVYNLFLELIEKDLFKNEDSLQVFLFCHNLMLDIEKVNVNHCFLNNYYGKTAIDTFPKLITVEEFKSRINNSSIRCICSYPAQEGIFYYNGTNIKKIKKNELWTEKDYYNEFKNMINKV